MSYTPYFPSLRTRCAPMGSQAKRAGRAAGSLCGLAVLFGRFFNTELVPADRGRGSRQRQFARVDVFWAFLSQVLHRGDSCRSALCRLQADAVSRGRSRPNDCTSAYCQARAALCLQWLQTLFKVLEQWFMPRTRGDWLGRNVRVIDGSGFSMPDTPANRSVWPYAGCQKRGCGFPVGKFVGLFCLHSGRLLSFAQDVWMALDLRLARRLLSFLRPTVVLLADRAYCGWGFLALLHRQKVDFVIRLHCARKIPRSSDRSVLLTWLRPQRPKTDSWWLWRRLPKLLILRLVRVTVPRRGFRTRSFRVVTSLLDRDQFPDEAIAQLYAQRWQIELHYRQIKTNLGLDVLRGLSPAIIERELWMHALAYNLVRALMLEAAILSGTSPGAYSFKGSLDALDSWSRIATPRSWVRLLHQLLLRIASDLVPLRPGRSEPRAKKRRPKNYQFLTRPRKSMRVSTSRSLK
jgi:hypothetical protein